MATAELRSGRDEDSHRRRKHRHRHRHESYYADGHRSSHRHRADRRDEDSDQEDSKRKSHRHRHRDEEHRSRRHGEAEARRDITSSGRSRHQEPAEANVGRKRHSVPHALPRPTPLSDSSTTSSTSSIDTPPERSSRITEVPLYHERQRARRAAEAAEASGRRHSIAEVQSSGRGRNERLVRTRTQLSARTPAPPPIVETRSDIGSVSSSSDDESPRGGVQVTPRTQATLTPSSRDLDVATPGSSRQSASSPEKMRRQSRPDGSFLGLLSRSTSSQAATSRRTVMSTRPKLNPTPPIAPAPTQTLSEQQLGTLTPSMRRANSITTPPAMIRRRTTPGILSGIMRPPPQQPMPAPQPAPAPAPPAPSAPEETVECLTCCDDIPKSRAAKLECDHIMCNSCLKRIFRLSVTDPQHMPPKCCTDKNIPLDFVAPLFDDKFKRNWNKKFQEFTTKDRMYCPKKGCGEWIKPQDQKLDRVVGRRYGVCPKCKTKVCKKCNTKWHGSKDCKNDEETKQLLDTAKKEGWQRCYDCKAMVQLAEGCNHMKCRCTAEFCMICGAKWKTCDCPWFNTPPDVDIPFPGILFPPPHLFRPRIRMQGNRAVPPPPPPPGAAGAGGYQAGIAARRAQERADERLARRMALDEMGDVDPLALFLDREWGLGGMDAGANVALNAAFNVLGGLGHLGIGLALGHDEAYEPARGRRRPPLNRRGQWTRPGGDDDANEPRERERRREHPPAPEPPHARVDSDVEDTDSDFNFDFGSPAREARRRLARRATIHGGRPSTAAMAGLANEGRRGNDRVGGWLEHVAGAPPQRPGVNVWDYEL